MFSATRIDAQFLSGVDGMERKAKAIAALKDSMRVYLDQIYNMIDGDGLVTHELDVAESAGMVDLGGNLRLTEINGDTGSSFYVELVVERVSTDELFTEEEQHLAAEEKGGEQGMAEEVGGT